MRTILTALAALMLFATPVVAASDPPVQSAEVVFWKSISSSTDADDFVAYLERYPHGVFAPLARNKLKRMGVVILVPKAPPKPQPAVVPSKPVANNGSIEGVYRATTPCGSKVKLEVIRKRAEGWFDTGGLRGKFSGNISPKGHFSLGVLAPWGAVGTLSGSLGRAVLEGDHFAVPCHVFQPFSFTKVE